MWTELPLLGFDTETTGVDPNRDRVVTASLILDSGEESVRRFWLIDPGVPIPPASTRIHGITTEKARAEGRPAAEALEEIASALAEHMSQGNPVVAFNATYDLTLLERDLARHELPTLSERLGGRVSPVLDPYLLDRYVDRYRRGKRRLENLVELYGVGNDDAFHDAEADVLATLRVLHAEAARYPELASASFSELEEAQRRTNAEFLAFLRRRNPNVSGSDAWPIAD